MRNGLTTLSGDINVNNVHKGILVILSAPSGGGKTSIANAVIAALKNNVTLERVVTYTTRSQRVNEVPGIDYYFISKEEFEQKRAGGFFLEWVYYHNNYYGSPASIQSGMLDGKSYLLVTDHQGAKTLQSYVPSAIFIWLIPPSLDVLEKRLRTRGTETEIVIQERLALAQRELSEEQKERVFSHWVMNDVFEHTVATVANIILMAYQ